MLLYAIVMFAAAAVIMGFARAIYRGRTDLIHEYHQTRVRDHLSYGKAFGKGLFLFSLGSLFSGLFSLLGESHTVISLAIGALLLGFGSGTVCLYRVQKKYNNGLF